MKHQTWFSTMVLTTVLSLHMILPAFSASLPVPERGFVSSRPARTWEEGLICGNGTIGVNALSRPLEERIIFTHERLFLPMGAPVMPPDQSARLFEIRRLIDKGLYKQACELQFNLSGQEGFMYPDYYVPALDLTIRTEADGEVRDYARSVDFQSGETRVHWADGRGVFERRMFVSRAEGVAVLLLTAPPSALDCRLALEPREPSDEFNADSDIKKRSDEIFREHVSDVKSTSGASWLTYSNRFSKAYPGSIHVLESYARVVTTGGTTEPQEDGALVVRGADRVLVFVDIRLLHDPDKSALEEMKRSLGALPADYRRLLDDHARIHGELFNRVRLDIGGGADHRCTTEELLEMSSYESPNRALVEKEFDAGRYNIICSTGEFPPTLQGVWGGTYVPGWASDFTHNGNVPSAIASYLMGNMPELMLAYTSYIESIVPWMEINARHLFGARGVVLPSRSTTHGFNNAAGRPISSTTTTSTPATENFSQITPFHLWKGLRLSSRTISTRVPTGGSSSPRPSRRKTRRATRTPRRHTMPLWTSRWPRSCCAIQLPPRVSLDAARRGSPPGKTCSPGCPII